MYSIQYSVFLKQGLQYKTSLSVNIKIEGHAHNVKIAHVLIWPCIHCQRIVRIFLFKKEKEWKYCISTENSANGNSRRRFISHLEVISQPLQHYKMQKFHSSQIACKYHHPLRFLFSWSLWTCAMGIFVLFLAFPDIYSAYFSCESPPWFVISFPSPLWSR